jgi:hypothetical protein
MNSVFQQLFHNIAFRMRVFAQEPGSELHTAFRSLFIRLALSELPAANTQPFAGTWRFCDSEPVNVRAQQDANEFL